MSLTFSVTSKIAFADKKLKAAFEKLKTSKTEDKKLYRWLNRAFDDLQIKVYICIYYVIIATHIYPIWMYICSFITYINKLAGS